MNSQESRTNGDQQSAAESDGRSPTLAIGFLKSRFYRNYLLLVLLLILAFNYVDRQALGLVLQDIKHDLQLSDTQLGLLTGFAFALFYSFMGIPIARWADRGNRVNIIALTTILWSGIVALSGVAATFTQLLLIRIGAGVGESGCVPPAHSLISDYFDRAERPRALAIYMLGGPLSVIFGYFGAGWINQIAGWRPMFVVLALPGLLVAVAAYFTLTEPRRNRRELLPGATRIKHVYSDRASIGAVCKTLWRIRTFRHLVFAFAVIFFLNYGIAQWVPAFFIRTHGLQTGELGTWLAIIFGFSGLLGIYGGGEFAARYAANNERLQLRCLALLFASLVLIRPFIYLVPSYRLAFLLMFPTSLAIFVGDGPLFALIQSLVPKHMRAIAIAIVYLFGNLIGMGLGPLAAGALSDAFRPWAGEESLRYALVALCPGYLWAFWHLWRASQTVKQDLEDVGVDGIPSTS